MALTYEVLLAFLHRRGIVPATNGQPSQFVGINWHKNSRVYIAMFAHRYMGCGTSDLEAIMHLLVKTGPCKIKERADILKLLKKEVSSCKLRCQSGEQVRALVARKIVNAQWKANSRFRNKKKSTTRFNKSTQRRTTIKTAIKSKRAAKDPKGQKIPEDPTKNGKSRASPKSNAALTKANTDQIPKNSGKGKKHPVRKDKKSADSKGQRAATTQRGQEIPKTRRSPTIRSEINLSVSEVCVKFISCGFRHLI